ncbi:MAG: acyl-CoA desaturase [Candidatus Rokubacteria bacterium 13_1_40CM_68_15]|nr:MAG: acyl-CoA desaturase [Candidatus Rokubacteria bacterium 13_1_40CM_68_15]
MAKAQALGAGWNTGMVMRDQIIPGDTSSAAAPRRALKFEPDSAFQLELRRRVDEYFRRTGRRQRDCWQMYLKTAIILAGLAVSYLLLVFAAHAWWQGVPLAVLLGFAAAGIGFNVQHDGGHDAYSEYHVVNKLMAMTLDMMGGSSYFWHWKHVVFHHTYVNVTGHDADINLGILARVTPHQTRLPYHRWQHLYLWPFYGLLAVKWQLVDDVRRLITGRIGSHRVRRPTGWDLVLLVAGKATFLAWAFGIPLLFHSVPAVLVYYGIAAVVLGTTLSVVFQVAHCVEEAAFPLPLMGTGRIEHAWAVHQAETTVDFARPSRLMAWLLGGLNFQIEHHLLPRISHVNYPAISKLVEQTCRDFGVTYTEHRSFWEGMTSHFRWLRRMGMLDTRVTLSDARRPHSESAHST